MTDKEIIKALECCGEKDDGCLHCPLYGTTVPECGMRLCRESLDLINRQQAEIEYLRGEREVILEDMQVRNNQIIEQQAEIEKLNVELVGMRGACNSYKMHYDNAKVEIERLKEEARTVDKDLEELDRPLTEIRAEAIKEFAERLKKHLKGNGGLYCVTTMNAQIDNLVKEMVGEGK